MSGSRTCTLDAECAAQCNGEQIEHPAYLVLCVCPGKKGNEGHGGREMGSEK